MPLTEEQKQRLQGNLGRPLALPGGLPPEIQAIASSLPQARPYLQSVGTSGPRIAYPPPQQNVERELGVEYAKQRIRALTPQASETIKRDFSRIDAFEGMLNDLESIASRVRKGPVKGSYAKYGAKVTGGGEFPDVDEEESINAVTYSDLRPAVAAGLYRAITGDDRISDRDAAARALPLIPDLYLQPKAFAKRLRIVKRGVQRRRQSIRKSISLGTSSTVQPGEDSAPLFYSVISDVLDEELND